MKKLFFVVFITVYYVVNNTYGHGHGDIYKVGHGDRYGHGDRDGHEYAEGSGFDYEYAQGDSTDVTNLRCKEHLTARTLDGTCNNLNIHWLGSRKSTYASMIPPQYSGCKFVNNKYINIIRKSYNGSPLPSTRNITTQLSKRKYRAEKTSLQKYTLNQLCVLLGQYYVHDMGNIERLTGFSCCTADNKQLRDEDRNSSCIPISVSNNDKWYAPHDVQCLSVVSSERKFNRCGAGQTNAKTAFFDLGLEYGHDLSELKNLRSKEDQCRMRTNENDFLPTTTTCQAAKCYVTGDERVNQTPMLVFFHFLYVHIHNYICDNKKSSNKESTFDEARNLNIAIYQRILYNEWLPAILGGNACNLACDPAEKKCGNYNSKIDPSTTNDFSQAVFRVFHNYINSNINFYNPDGKITMSKPLSDMNSGLVNILETQSERDNMLRGLLNDPINENGPSVEILNKIFKNSKVFGSDLAAVDIQRGRDHGVPPFYAYISYCIDKHFKLTTWEDLKPFFDDLAMADLKKMYKSPKDVDLIVGVFLEKRTGLYALFGKIGRCVVCEQMKRSKFGDRFFYQLTDSPIRYTKEQLKEIERITFAKLLCLVTGLKQIQLNAFFTEDPLHNPKVDCTKIGKINLNLFFK